MQEHIENTLASLVAIPSVSSDAFACRAIIDFVQNELQGYDLTIDTHYESASPWLIATTQNTKTPDILFYAHLDVVPGPSQLFTLQKYDGHLKGRGVFDMKQVVACYLEFLHTHAHDLSRLNIGFLFTTDEENDSKSMEEVIAAGIRPKVVFMPDGGDNWTIEKRAKGFYAAELIATGKGAHGSRPWEGVSALHTLLDAINILRNTYTLTEKDHPTFMVNSIKSGHTFNQIPDLAIAQLDFRCFNQYEMDDYIALLASITDGRDDLKLSVYKYGNVVNFDETSPYVQGFLRAFKQIRGISPTFSDSYGGSDAIYFAPLGIPCIIMEPHGGGRHSNDEWLKASDLIVYYQLLEHWILQDAGISSRSSNKTPVRKNETHGLRKLSISTLIE